MNLYREHRGGRRIRTLGTLVMLVSLSLIGLGCWGGDDGSGGTVPATSPGQTAGTTTTTVEEVVDDNAAYSTFRSKDPFIAQLVSDGTTETTGGEGGQTTSTTSPSGSGQTSSTTVFRPTSTTSGQSTGTTQSGGTTTTGGTGTTGAPASTTSTTVGHVHTLKVLSVGQVAGAATVTLQVDSSVYTDKRIGSVVSTSWGQIKVLDINTSSRVVTLLHGSETLNLIVGQVIYE